MPERAITKLQSTKNHNASSRLFAILIAFGAFAKPVLAQSQDEFYYQMSNSLGLLNYCVSKGFPSGNSASIYEKFIKSLPEPADLGEAELRQKKGSEGFYYNDPESVMAVEQLAEGSGQTLEEHCKSYDENAKAFGSNG